MKSKLAQQALRKRIATTQALTPAQRLEAFLEHCQLVAELNEAGRRYRAKVEAGVR